MSEERFYTVIDHYVPYKGKWFLGKEVPEGCKKPLYCKSYWKDRLIFATRQDAQKAISGSRERMHMDGILEHKIDPRLVLIEAESIPRSFVIYLQIKDRFGHPDKRLSYKVCGLRRRTRCVLARFGDIKGGYDEECKSFNGAFLKAICELTQATDVKGNIEGLGGEERD